jgi:branched-subunit amino acid aminotransferase/4-amino-4-deoxychorismate lyase
MTPGDDFPVYFNGRIVPAGTPLIAAEDLGFQQGLSVFDTVLYKDGCLWFVEDHLARFEHAARDLGLSWPPPADPLTALRELAAEIDEQDIALRLTLTRGAPGRGASFAITARRVERPADPGVVVHVSAQGRAVGDPIDEVKTTNRMFYVRAREAAARHGAWEALIPSVEGDLLEGTISNLFVVRGDVLLTAGVERGLLPGIVRGRLLDSLTSDPLALPGGATLAVRVDRVPAAELVAADEAFLTNTTGRLLPIVRVLGSGDDSLDLPGAAGPVTRALRARLDALEAAYLASRNPSGGAR